MYIHQPGGPTISCGHRVPKTTQGAAITARLHCPTSDVCRSAKGSDSQEQSHRVRVWARARCGCVVTIASCVICRIGCLKTAKACCEARGADPSTWRVDVTPIGWHAWVPRLRIPPKTWDRCASVQPDPHPLYSLDAFFHTAPPTGPREGDRLSVAGPAPGHEN